MSQTILDVPALWGFLGALIYASTVTTAALWGDSPAPDGLHRKRVFAEFAICIIVGPVLAEGFGPTLFKLQWLAQLDHRAVSLTVGLSANYLWPIAVRAMGRRVKRFGSP